MGVSVSASTAILLVAAMVSFGMVYSAQDVAQEVVMEAQQLMTERQQDMLATSLVIYPVGSFYNDTLVFQYSNITVKNTGNMVIQLDQLRLLVNGQFTSFNPVLEGGITSNFLMPKEVVVLVTGQEFRVDELNRIMVVTGNGVSDIYAYGGS